MTVARRHVFRLERPACTNVDQRAVGLVLRLHGQDVGSARSDLQNVRLRHVTQRVRKHACQKGAKGFLRHPEFTVPQQGFAEHLQCARSRHDEGIQSRDHQVLAAEVQHELRGFAGDERAGPQGLCQIRGRDVGNPAHRPRSQHPAAAFAVQELHPKRGGSPSKRPAQKKQAQRSYKACFLRAARHPIERQFAPPNLHRTCSRIKNFEGLPASTRIPTPCIRHHSGDNQPPWPRLLPPRASLTCSRPLAHTGSTFRSRRVLLLSQYLACPFQRFFLFVRQVVVANLVDFVQNGVDLAL